MVFEKLMSTIKISFFRNTCGNYLPKIEILVQNEFESHMLAIKISFFGKSHDVKSPLWTICGSQSCLDKPPIFLIWCLSCSGPSTHIRPVWVPGRGGARESSLMVGTYLLHLGIVQYPHLDAISEGRAPFTIWEIDHHLCNADGTN